MGITDEVDEILNTVAIPKYGIALEKYKCERYENTKEFRSLCENLYQLMLDGKKEEVYELSKLIRSKTNVHESPFMEHNVENRVIYALSSLGVGIGLLMNIEKKEGKNTVIDSFKILEREKLISVITETSLLLRKSEYITGGYPSNVIYFETSEVSKKIDSIVERYTIDEDYNRYNLDEEYNREALTLSESFENVEHLIDKFISPLSLVKFIDRVYKERDKPFTIENAVCDWPALNSRPWTKISYLIKEIGFLRFVPVEIGEKYTDKDWKQVMMPFGEFLKVYLLTTTKEKGYLAQYDLFSYVPKLLDDIIIPDYCYTLFPNDDEERRSVNINFWLGPKNTVSPLHRDPLHNFFVQVFGYKYLRLYPSSESEKVCPNQDDDLLHNTSKVNIENIDYNNYPLMKEAKYFECILKPGDLCFIPSNCWHFVKSLTVSCSLSIWIK